MLILFVLVGILLSLLILLIIGNYAYYYYYPDKTVKETLANPYLLNSSTSKGLSGSDGKNGIHAGFAVNGINAGPAVKGAMGISGDKSLQKGPKGNRGDSGMLGVHGKNGKSGVKGPPSNSVIPFISQNLEINSNNVPVILEHEFSYNGNVYKLTGSFLFEEIVSIALDNNNVIDTTNYIDIGSSRKGRKIYSTIQIALETDTIFYISPPISRTGYMITSPSHFTNNTFNVDEIIIGHRREFALDFSTVPSNSHIFNYFVGGTARYRAIINIDPPLPNAYPRLEERFSLLPITSYNIEKINHQSKGGFVKIKESGVDVPIYMLSQKLIVGKVIRKDASNEVNLWTVENYTKLSDSLDKSYPKLIEGFNQMEQDMNSFKTDLLKAKTITISPQNPDIYENIKFSLKSDPNLNSAESFSTKMHLNNLSLAYPNTSAVLSYPSQLKGSKLFVKFFIRVKADNFEDKKYLVWVSQFDLIPVIVTSSNSLILNTIEHVFSDPDLTVDYISGYIYYPVKIGFTDNLDFEKFFGRRVVFKFSVSSLDFETHFGSPNNFDGSVSVRLAGQQNTDNAFEGSNTEYDFQPGAVDDIWGFDFNFSATKFDVEKNTFVVGYEQSNGTIVSQRVPGFRQSNGDYVFDVPSSGY